MNSTMNSRRPSQSIKSVNLSEMQDSESIIRAYKKKKAELEVMREKFYTTETALMTAQQEQMLVNEENYNLKA
jgi:hypothetical protein